MPAPLAKSSVGALWHWAQIGLKISACNWARVPGSGTSCGASVLLDADQPPDLSLRRLNGLDLSGLDFSKVNLRGAYMNKATLTGATAKPPQANRSP